MDIDSGSQYHFRSGSDIWRNEHHVCGCGKSCARDRGAQSPGIFSSQYFDVVYRRVCHPGFNRRSRRRYHRLCGQWGFFEYDDRRAFSLFYFPGNPGNPVTRHHTEYLDRLCRRIFPCAQSFKDYHS